MRHVAGTNGPPPEAPVSLQSATPCFMRPFLRCKELFQAFVGHLEWWQVGCSGEVQKALSVGAHCFGTAAERGTVLKEGTQRKPPVLGDGLCPDVCTHCPSIPIRVQNQCEAHAGSDLCVACDTWWSSIVAQMNYGCDLSAFSFTLRVRIRRPGVRIP